MGGESEMGVESYAEDLGSFSKRKRVVVDGDVRMEVGLVVVRGEKGDGGFVGGNGKAVGGCPVRDGRKVGVN